VEQGLHRPGGRPGTTGAGGDIDYRLARQAVLHAFRAGELSAAQVCDAQPELRRNAEFCGEPTDHPCPICAEELRHVTYVFGPRLPQHGRCVSVRAELERLANRRASYTGYVVEVCVGCGWNHLVRSYLLGTSA
jgi:hypothetical protein